MDIAPVSYILLYDRAVHGFKSCCLLGKFMILDYLQINATDDVHDASNKYVAH